MNWSAEMESHSTANRARVRKGLCQAGGGKRFEDLVLLVEIYFVYSVGEAEANRRNRQLTKTPQLASAHAGTDQ